MSFPKKAAALLQITETGSIIIGVIENPIGELVSLPDNTGGIFVTTSLSGSDVGGVMRFSAPIAAETVSILNNVDPITDGTYPADGQPDYPRSMKVKFTNTAGATVSVVVTISGILNTGVLGSEVFTFTDVAGAETQEGDKAFITVTNVVVSGMSGEDADEDLEVGVGDKFGIPIGAGTLANVSKVNLNDADETGFTEGLTYGTVIPATVANGSNDYTVWYEVTY